MVLLSEIADVQTGPFGSQLHCDDYVTDGTPIITVENLGNFKISTECISRISNEDRVRLSKYSLKAGDIVFSRVGSVDRCSFVTSDEEGWLFSGRCLRIRPNTDVNSLYLYYYLNKSSVKKYIHSISFGATMPSLNTKLMSSLEIEFPKLEIQNRIASFLFLLDTYIVKLTKINDYLEQICQTSFDEVFNENNPCKKIEELGSVVGGSTPSKSHPEYFTNNGIAWLTPKDLSLIKSKFIQHGENDITDLGLKNSSAKLMPKNSILFSSRAPIGYMAISSGEVSTNQGFKSIVLYDEVYLAYVYYFLKNNIYNIQSMASGSTFPEVSGSMMKSINVPIPDNKLLEKFNKITQCVFNYQKKIESEIKILTTLRDILINRLIR